MSQSENDAQLPLQLSEGDLKTLRYATQLDGVGGEDVSAWVLRVALAAARARIEQSGPREPVEAEKPRPPKPPPSKGLGICRCGLTQDPRDECDGSCIMRF